MKYFLTAFIVVLFVTAEMFACNMFKITKNKSTFVGNNEDWWSPMTQIWFEPKQNTKYGYMAVEFHNKFAQGAINEGGLMFDGFSMPLIQTKDTSDKEYIEMNKVIEKIMHSFSSV